jgi:hypothetical protein
VDAVYEPDRREWFKVKHTRSADYVVGGYRLHKRGADLVGSLLLGCTPRMGSWPALASPAASRWYGCWTGEVGRWLVSER